MTPNRLKILDCTLRDGGYINNWEFGFENIKQIILNLSTAHLDFVECGFLKPNLYQKDKTLFNNFSQLLNLAPSNLNTKFGLMLNFGDVDISNIEKNINKNIFLRIAFKKEVGIKALDFARQLKEKNYDIFISPMHTYSYSKIELEKLINKVNEINPMACSIVDTIGAMNISDAIKIFSIMDNLLNKDISLCFHSHNNLKLSFENANAIINQNSPRQLIIDSALMGMGRGAGNLASELITALYDNYDLQLIKNTIEKFIKPIYDKTPWGPSMPYFLSANCKLHPNYAKYLIEKQVPIEKMEDIFKQIPENKKERFDSSFIEKLI